MSKRVGYHTDLAKCFVSSFLHDLRQVSDEWRSGIIGADEPLQVEHLHVMHHVVIPELRLQPDEQSFDPAGIESKLFKTLEHVVHRVGCLVGKPSDAFSPVRGKFVVMDNRKAPLYQECIELGDDDFHVGDLTGLIVDKR